MSASPIPPLVELKCRNCGSALSPEEFSPQLAAARCRHCGSLFALPVASGGRVLPRPDAPMPRNCQIRDDGYTLEITRKWKDAAAWFLLVFSLFWNGFMIGWHTIALTTGVWAMSLFGLLHTAIGLFLIYTTAARFVNWTVVRANTTTLEVKSGPLPWRGDKSLSSPDIRQLYCAEKITRNKNGTSTSYRVEAVLDGNRRETLVTGLTQAEHALFLEQQLERHLKIADVPVEGEYGR